MPETWAALEQAMRLLAPDHPESIAGWREIVTVEVLANLLGLTHRDAHDRLRGRTTWTEGERAQLVQHLAAHREHGILPDAQ